MKAFLPGTFGHRLYNSALAVLLLAAAPAWIPWILSSAKRRRNFADRLGLRLDGVPGPSGKRRIWIHAVSVGETLSAGPLVRRLRRLAPDAEILFSTVTVTGREIAEKSVAAVTEARFYFPFDLPCLSRRFLDRIRPDVVVLLETEIWPNFLSECAGRRIPALIVNGRLSERSFRGYLRLRSLFARVLACLGAITTQTEDDAGRYRKLGAPPSIVEVTGNMKFDIAPPTVEGSPLTALLLREKEKGSSWFVAGSTHEGEEEQVLRAFAEARSVDGTVKLLLAPRHPERFAAVEELCLRGKLETIRRTRLEGDAQAILPPVVLLDTVGELAAAYAAADIAFVGGSLVPKGGHNILEPAYFGVPTLVGPHMENFREIAGIFREAKAVGMVSGVDELAERLSGWARDRAREAEMGRRARILLDAFRGATERNAGILLRLLGRTEEAGG
jgi:3-deoxy-D-manno-octulosonic-acid transferase